MLFHKKTLPTLLSTALLLGVPSLALPIQANAVISTVDFSDLVAKVSPSVARVNVTKKISPDELAKAQASQLIRQYLGKQPSVDMPQSAVEQSYGTGFFVTADGYMLTNNHVIDGADKITVTLNDRRELDAKLIGTDERSDVAVLKIQGNNFPALPLGDSDKLKVGEPVLAIGSPFGFDYSASAGIVSAKSRNFSRENSVPFIQTDVAINPGNSGGPLFNQKGEVVGINSRIFTGTGGYMGLSFSIPMNLAMDIYQQIRTHGKVTRAYLGLFPQDIDRTLAEAYGLDKPQGALITKVSPNTPAEKAGLKAGDIILAYNNAPISTAADLLNRVNIAKPNDNFALKVQRNKQLLTLNGQLIEAPNDVAADGVVNMNNGGVRLGLRLRELQEGEQKELGDNGVMITAVEPTSLAASAGLQAGDIVTQLNQQTINGVKDFSQALKQLPKKGVVTIGLLRQGVPMIIGLRIE